MNFFIVSAGQPGSEYIEDNFKEILDTNEFALHANTQQKGTYYAIEDGDVLILKYQRNFVAYGIAVSRYSDESKEFTLRVKVEEWIKYDYDNPNKGVPRDGIQKATIGGGIYGTVKTVRPQFGLQKIREINDAHPAFDVIFEEYESKKLNIIKEGDFFDLHEEVFNHLLKISESDPDFTFVVRDSNNANALQKGYWFYGEDTVAVSFWTGMDFIEDRPAISFIINPDEHCKLVIQTDVFEDLRSYFEDERWWAKELTGLYQRDTMFVKEYKNFQTNDYIHCLNYFLNTDCHTINKIIYQDNVEPGLRQRIIDEEEEGYFDVFVLKVSPKKFNLSLNNLFKYRQSDLPELALYSLDDENKGDSLKSINIKCYGLIKNETIKIDNSKWVFITGENGSGKTMFLRAIAVALGNKMLTDKELTNNDFSIDADFICGKRIISFKRFRNENVKLKISTMLRGLAMYGPYRLQQASGLIEDDTFKELLGKNGSFESLFGDSAKLLSLEKQLEIWNTAPRKNDKLIDSRIKQIFSLLPKIIPDLRKIQFKKNKRNKFEIEYLIRSEGSEELMNLKWHELSSGNKSILNLVSDILIRLFHQQPKVTDPSELRGIVMIDEIDLHLHPKAQRDLVLTLSETFPLIQFIVTTHSPIPLLGAPKESTFITIERDYVEGVKATKLDIDISELLPNSILSSPIFDFDSYINSNYDKTKRLRTENDYDDILFYKILEKKIKEKSLRNNN